MLGPRARAAGLLYEGSACAGSVLLVLVWQTPIGTAIEEATGFRPALIGAEINSLATTLLPLPGPVAPPGPVVPAAPAFPTIAPAAPANAPAVVGNGGTSAVGQQPSVPSQAVIPAPASAASVPGGDPSAEAPR